MIASNKKYQKTNIYFVKIIPLKNNETQLNGFIHKKVHTQFFSFAQKIKRFFLNTLLTLLPAAIEIQLVSYIKKKNLVKNVYRSPETFFIAHLAEENHLTITPQYPYDRKFYFELTFDIDYKQDYDLLPHFLEDLAKHNFPATINLITHADYTISHSFISDLQKSGFVIGLHGDTHNTALAFLPKTIIRRKLQRAIDRLGFLPFGYRSPGLSYSRNLIEVLDELGFLYDSSLTTGISMYTSLEFPYVFQHAGLRMIEIPLFMQDYNFFVNGLYSEQEVIRIFETQITEIEKIGGVALINLHPAISFDKKVFWQALLGFMKQYKKVAYISTIYDLLKNKEG